MNNSKIDQLTSEEKQDRLDELNSHKINLETAQIAWSDLQRHFASGKTIYVSQDLDLVTVAKTVQKDEAKTVKTWMDNGLIHSVYDEQAKNWHENDSIVWAVVVRPWVLIQPIED